MKLVAIAFAAATFIGASCPNPSPAPPDVVVDAAPPSPTPPPPLVIDATTIDVIPPFIDATPPAPSCATACDSMRRNGCREGSLPNCAAKLCATNADPRFKHYDVTCLTNAATPDAIANCGIGCTQ